MCPCMQLYNTTSAAVAAFPQVTPAVPVSSVPTGAKLAASDVTARQFEVQATFKLLPPGTSSSSSSTHKGTLTESGQRRSTTTTTSSSSSSSGSFVKLPDEFAFGIRLELGNGRFADGYLKGTVRSLAPQSSAYVVDSLSVWFDRSQAGGSTNTTFLEGGPVPLPFDKDKAWTVPDTPLDLSVWVDHGVVEIFAMKGLARLTSRIYPEDDTVAWGVSTWSSPPKPTAGVAVDRGAAASSAEVLGPPTVLSGLYCWWCRMWSSPCKDTRCFSASSRWPEPGDWHSLLDGQVWEMKSAWLPPSC